MSRPVRPTSPTHVQVILLHRGYRFPAILVQLVVCHMRRALRDILAVNSLVLSTGTAATLDHVVCEHLMSSASTRVL